MVLTQKSNIPFSHEHSNRSSPHLPELISHLKSSTPQSHSTSNHSKLSPPPSQNHNSPSPPPMSQPARNYAARARMTPRRRFAEKNRKSPHDNAPSLALPQQLDTTAHEISSIHTPYPLIRRFRPEPAAAAGRGAVSKARVRRPPRKLFAENSNFRARARCVCVRNRKSK